MPPHATLRIAIEMDVDARGRASRVIVKAPAPYDERFARCVESAVEAAAAPFGVPCRGGRTAMARTEMVIGVSAR